MYMYKHKKKNNITIVLSVLYVHKYNDHCGHQPVTKFLDAQKIFQIILYQWEDYASEFSKKFSSKTTKS